MSYQGIIPTPLKMERIPAVLAATGFAKSTLYLRISQGLWTKPVKLGGPRAVGFPAHEVQAVIAASVSGKTEDEIKLLVSNLMSARKHAS